MKLSECAGCQLPKVRQDKKYKLSCTAILVGGAELAQGTAVCGTCANQTRVGAGPGPPRSASTCGCVAYLAKQAWLCGRCADGSRRASSRPEEDLIVHGCARLGLAESAVT